MVRAGGRTDFVGAWRWAAWSEPGVWQAFLEGYRAVKPIADVDLAAVPLLDGVSRLRSLGLVAVNASHRGSLPVLGRKLQRQMNFLRSWERDYVVALDASRMQCVMTRASEAIVFPVVASIVHPDAVRAVVRSAYDVGTVTDCCLVERGLNDTYILSTSTARYVARLYRAGWRSHAEVAYELELLLHLAASRVSVSAPIPARDGTVTRAVLTPEGVRDLALFTYAAGKPLRWTAEQAYPAGKLLSAIHDATQNFRSRHARIAYDLENLIDIPLISIDPFLDDRPADRAFLRRFAATLRAIAVETLGGDFEWGPCHGDFGANNVHVSDRGVLTVFDFDFCGPGWRMFDLVIIELEVGVAQPARRVGVLPEGIWRDTADSSTESGGTPSLPGVATLVGFGIAGP